MSALGQGLNLSPDATTVLRKVEEISRSRRDFVRGGEVVKQLGMQRARVAKALQELRSQELVRISGPEDAEEIDFALVSIHPVNREFVRKF
jgi:Mn-dependent DtxR family transcriptional regulator